LSSREGVGRKAEIGASGVRCLDEDVPMRTLRPAIHLDEAEWERVKRRIITRLDEIGVIYITRPNQTIELLDGVRAADLRECLDGYEWFAEP
jgi:hypothetical protein